MEQLAILTILLCVFNFSLAIPFRINPESVFIKSTLLFKNNASDVSQDDSNDFPTDPRVTPQVTDQDARTVLQDYGFLSTDDVVTRLDQTTDDSTKNAVKRFQQRYNLPDSGILDDDTRRLIAAPRCGVAAELNAIDDRWTKRSLTFKIRSYPRSLSPAEARQLITQAFTEWTKHVMLDVSEVTQGEADIYVSEEQAIHQNRLGDDCRFTSNTTLAHAFYPQIGDIHYNSMRSYTPDEFFSATIHEIGHSLGLDHTNSKTSIMFPFHIRYHTEIPPEDRRALQALYGVRATVKPTLAPRFETNIPHLCSLDKFDTILNDAQGQTYVLAGDYYYPLSERNPKGRRISSKWPKLPGSIDVAFTYRTNKTFFFKRNRVWVYADNQLEAGYPKLIKDDFPGMPGNLSALFVTKYGSLLAIRKKQYWFYSPRKTPQVGKEFPRLVYDFKGMPANLSAALRHTDGVSYFFKDRSFYVLNMKDYTMGPATPMDQRWFLC